MIYGPPGGAGRVTTTIHLQRDVAMNAEESYTLDALLQFLKQAEAAIHDLLVNIREFDRVEL